MRARQDVNDQLRMLIAAQRGMVTVGQAAELGLGSNALARLVSQGHWIRLTRGLYDAAPLSVGFEKQAWMAVLASGPDAAIGGEAALRLHGLDRPVSVVDVWVPPENQPDPLPGVVVHRDFLGRVERRRGSPARISIEDATVDVGQQLPTGQLVGLLSDASRSRLVSLDRVGEVIKGRRRVRGRKRFKEILGDLEGIESNLEYVYRRDVERAHGLPTGRRNQSVSAGTRSDVEYEEYGVLVELDGRLGHLDADSAFRDLRRDNRHALTGRTTLRYGSADVRGRACEVATQVAAALTVRGWRGALEACPRCWRLQAG